MRDFPARATAIMSVRNVMMRTIDPALPRIGTDFMIQIVYSHNPLAESESLAAH
jgi:hypothetical protein